MNVLVILSWSKVGGTHFALAAAIGQARGVTPVHLDQLYHLPGTDWQARPEAEFVALHDAAIAAAAWIVDGNHSRCLPGRLARATGLILLDAPTAVSLFRYLRRSLFERDRVGGLEGGRESVTWTMIRHIAGATRRNRRRYRADFARIDLPKVSLATPRALAAFYRAENLGRRQPARPPTAG